MQVSSTCSESLAITEALIHPRAPILTAPPLPAPEESAQQGHSGVFGFGYYNNTNSASFGATPFFSLTGQRKEILPSAVSLANTFPQIERSVSSTKGEEKDVEVVSLVSSDSDHEKSDHGEVEEGEEESEEGSEEEEGEEGEDVIAIDDDSNSEVGGRSPRPSTSKVTSTSCLVPPRKWPADEVMVTSSQSMDSSDCLIVSADTSYISVVNDSKGSGGLMSLNASGPDLQPASSGDGKSKTENNNTESIGSVAPSGQKRKHTEAEDEACPKSTKKNEVSLELKAIVACLIPGFGICCS